MSAPLPPPETDATPFEKVSVVALANAWALPFLSVTVGGVAGAGDEDAPPNVSAWSPV